MAILVTGAAGFIGFHVCKRLLSECPDTEVVGIDNLNDYYEVSLKNDRIEQLNKFANFVFHKRALEDRHGIDSLFHEHDFDYVIHLGAQAGVRYSVDNPHAYADSNLTGHLHILEGCRQHKVLHLVFASSSSVYGMNKKMPFSVDDAVDHPVSFYAATKKANELMSHSYAHLYNLSTTGLRLFTVYGSWGRPDMAPMLFANAITKGEPIQVNNYGNMQRDFTHVNDVVECIFRIMTKPPATSSDWAPETDSLSESRAPYKIYNVGAGKPTKLMEFIECLETELGTKATMELREMQAGDVVSTWADSDDLHKAIGFTPQVDIREGVREFVAWYKSYYPAAQGES